MTKKLGASLAVAVLLATSACGAGRPSESDLSKALQHGLDVVGIGTTHVPKKTADCLARLLEKSKASDAFLKAVASNDQQYRRSRQDDKVLRGLGTQGSGCERLTP